MDFALIMFIALLVTGSIWLWDVASGAHRRRLDAKPGTVREPILVEYSRAFFPVILIVFMLRSFVVEPFRIPSGSMLPSLLVGDFILVNKYKYGIRLPILNSKVMDVGSPNRGDVMVFRYPHNPSINYIKRVIGLPGDRVAYRNKTVYINGTAMPQEAEGEYLFEESGQRVVAARKLAESLDGVRHEILHDERVNQIEREFTVPTGQYFVMGDNRDHSNDSRFWGMVDDSLVVGKAFLIWFSWDAANGGGVNWSRIGSFIH
jgi:signal peptidase I